MAHESHKSGPTQVRSCTDVLCCVIFVLITLALLGGGIYALIAGNVAGILTPYDPDGRGCGVDGDVKNYPYIFFASPHLDSLWVTTCVSKCPSSPTDTLDCVVNSVVKKCSATTGTNNTDSVEIYGTVAVAKICMPSDATVVAAISSAISFGAFQDIINSWKIILGSVGIAIAVCIVFMVLMRCCAKFIVWILIIFTILILVALGAVFIIPAKYLPTNAATAAISTVNSTVTIIIGAVLLVVAVAILIIVICFRKKINLAASITEVASKFVASECLLFLLPIGLFIAMLLFIAFWVALAAAFYSLGPVNTQPRSLPFAHYKFSGPIIGLLVFHALYLLWGLIFFIETGAFLVSGAAVGYYYKTASPFSQSSKRYSRYHSPSVVKGSLLWLLIGWLKLIYDILTPDAEGGCLGGLRKCCDTVWCCCVNYIFNCIDKGAHVIIHLEGQAYCNSAKTATALKLRNLNLTGLVETTTFIFNWLARLSIAGITALIAYILLTRTDPYKTTISEAWIPSVVILIIGFTIASFFISLYSDASDAIYYCYLAQGEDSASCPEELRDFIEKTKAYETGN